MNRFNNRKKRKFRIPSMKHRKQVEEPKKELTKEQKEELTRQLLETMEKNRKAVLSLHAPRPGRRF